MRTNSRIRSLAFGMIGLAALALSGTGCIIESSGGPCLPDLFVPWQIVANTAGDPPITCATAGASTVELDVNGQTFVDPCPAGVSSGEFAIPLADSGSYTLDGFLVASNGQVISEVHPPTVTVGCGSFQTPTMILPVN